VYKEDWTQNYDSGRSWRTFHTPFSLSRGFL